MRYAKVKSKPHFTHYNFIKSSDLSAEQIELNFINKQVIDDNDKLSLSISSPLTITKGHFFQTTTIGYEEDGSYKTVKNTYDLKSKNKQIDFKFNYSYSLKEDINFISGMSYSDNYENISNLSNTSIFAGIKKNF